MHSAWPAESQNGITAVERLQIDCAMRGRNAGTEKDCIVAVRGMWLSISIY